jgi:SAM-dependent methyltransferase
MSTASPGSVGHDPDTVAYFDDHVIDYGTDRLEPVADAIARLGNSGSLVDLGCGTGNTLQFVRDQTGVTEVVGIDVSPKCLERTKERLGCEVHLGSIMDPEVAGGFAGRFDYAVVAAVLHHLIGRSRKQSREFARMAVDNALTMLKPGGHLIVVEPIFYPSLAMDGIFYLKKAVTRMTSSRVKLGSWDNNIGPPVVSYYTNEELFEMVTGKGHGEIVERDIQPQALPRGANLLLRKTDTTVVVRKPS